MQNDKTKSKKRKLFNIILIIGGVLIFALTSLLLWNTFSPKPMGEKLEYIGRHDYGCIILFCDSSPGTKYYYATNMDIGDVEMYFRGANISKDVNSGGTSADGYSFSFLNFTSKKDLSRAVLYFYDQGDEMTRASHLDLKNKKHVVEIDAKDYQIIKDSL